MRIRRDWSAEEDALLGTATDSEIAERLGRTMHGVQKRRQMMGIPAHRASKSHPTPYRDEKKTAKIQAMFTPREYEEICAACERLGKRPWEMSRAGLLALIRD